MGQFQWLKATLVVFLLSGEYFAQAETESSPHSKRERLESRYQAEEFVPATYKPSRQEIRDSKVPFLAKGDEATLAAFKEFLNKYPRSPEARVDYILYLDRKSRLADALNEARRAAEEFPDQVRLKIIRDHLEKASIATNRKARAAARQAMDAQLAAFNQWVVEYRRSGKKGRRANERTSSSVESSALKDQKPDGH